MKIRVGFGYDVHQLVEEADFWLGGIKIDHVKGAIGHSDADVLIHVICDALLGAANLRDIGYHFSDKDQKFKGIDSKVLLGDVHRLLQDKGWHIENIDSTICLQEPKIGKFIPAMKEILSKVLDIEMDAVSIKATTTERLGFEGREEGVSAYAVVLIAKP